MYNYVMRIILASASPRRKELLTQIAPDFEVIPFAGEENLPLADPAKYVKELARLKAASVAGSFPEAFVIGADTVVVFKGRIIGKPKNPDHAFSILKELSGKTHSVFTGVCVVKGKRSRVFAKKSRVTFFPLSDKVILDYIATGSPMDKAGGYGIQDSGFVRRIKGSFNNVMGLPTEKLQKLLKREGRNE